MNKLIVIVGPSGAGKTTLAQALAKTGRFRLAFEQHDERPFQALFKRDAKYALANQLDYLIVRAEQEYQLRQVDKPALMDGGLELDFHGFTRLFHKHGWLNDDELDLCKRLYLFTRAVLPPPDLIVAVSANSQIISERLASRNRINIASSEDAELLNQYIGEWLENVPTGKILKLDLSDENISCSNSVQTIIKKMDKT